MKSRTSFFNGTVLKKDITRFAPVWALYSVFLLMLFSTVDTPMGVARGVLGMSVVNFIYAGICASVLFGDLFQSRMCNALHAMPLRREGWFITHMSAGFLFSFVPNALTALVLGMLMGLMGQFWYLALIWLAIMTLQFLFFFGVGCFSVMCAGNRLGMYAVYGIINLLSMLVYVLVDQFYEPLLYGIRMDTSSFDLFCPVVYMAGTEFISYDYDSILGFVVNELPWPSWLYLAVCALIGLGLLVASVALYRRRKLEAAGDFIVLRPLQPVFLVIYTFGVGVLLYGINELFGIGIAYGFMAVGIVVGFFTGKMLLERTVKVLRLKSILGFVLFAAIFGGSLLITWLDPLGIARQIPDTDEIAYVRLFTEEEAYLYLDPDASCVQAESAEEIEQIKEIHQTLLTEHWGSDCYATPIILHYQLKDGTTLTRYYYMKSLSAVYDRVVKHLSSPEYLFSPEGVPILPEAVTSVWFDMSHTTSDKYYNETLTDPAMIRKLVDAIIADCEAGHMGQHHSLNIGDYQVAWVTLDLNTYLFSAPVDGMRSESAVDLSINTSCTNTIKALEEITEQLEQIRLNPVT